MMNLSSPTARSQGKFVGKVAAPLHLPAFILEASFEVFRQISNKRRKG